MDYKNLDEITWMILKSIEKVSYARNTKIQKLIYIYEEEVDRGIFQTDFSFEAFNYGPFSKRVLEVTDLLLANGIIVDLRDCYGETDKSKVLLEKLSKKNLNLDRHLFEGICSVFVNKTSSDILKYVYNNYKDKLSKSLIINEIIYEESDYDWIRDAEKHIDQIKREFNKNKN